ncbi:MAG: HAD family phosphatase [Verrucomicrobia bacterium]|nr:HAD family phosphatase [Verrucomicrobiota bacterium]
MSPDGPGMPSPVNPSRPPYPFAAVLFDLDGVIVDNTALHRQTWEGFLRRHGFKPTVADLRAMDGRRAEEIIAQHFPPSRVSPGEAARLIEERETLYGERLLRGPVQAVAGVEAFLRGLAWLRVPCVLATSAHRLNVERVLGKLGLRESFLAWVTADDVTDGKPAPEVYLKAAARAGAAPERCLVIEDALAGVQAAKAAGAACLGLTTGVSAAALAENGADWTAGDFNGIPAPLGLKLDGLG